MAKQPTATLELTANGSDAWSLSAVIQNPGPAALDATYFVPWVPGNVLVHDAAGKPIAIVQPPLDTPVRPQPLHVAAGGTAKLGSPITLRFGAPGKDGFVWSIAGTRVPVHISCDITLDGHAPIHAEGNL